MADFDDIDGHFQTHTDLCTDADDLETDAAPGCDIGSRVFDKFMQRGSDIGYNDYRKKGFEGDSDVLQSICDSGLGPSVSFDELRSGGLGGLSSDNLKQFQKLSIQEDITKPICISENSSEQSETETVTPAQEKLCSEEEEIFEQDNDGDTQLHNAIIQLFNPVALYFISKVSHYSYLNIPNNLLQTPLHLATLTKMTQVVRRLMAAGADIMTRDHRGDTALHIACREGFEDVTSCLVEPVTYNETLENRYRIPYQKIPQNLEIRNYNGQTCLHVAAEGTHLAVMRLLLKKGADINAQDGKSGRTVLHYAVESGNKILLEFLLQFYNVNIECKTYGGLTPMLLAQGRGFTDIVHRLVNAGARFESLASEDTDSDDDMDEGIDDLQLKENILTLR